MLIYIMLLILKLAGFLNFEWTVYILTEPVSSRPLIKVVF